MPTNLEAAQSQLAIAQEAHADALAVLASSTANKAKADELSLDPRADLDKAVASVNASATKVDIAQRRVQLAANRLAQAEEAVKVAGVEALKADLAQADIKLAQDDEAVLAEVAGFIDSMAPRLATLHNAKVARDAVAHQLADQPSPVSSPAVVALKVNQPSSRQAVAILRDTGTLPGATVDIHATLNAIVSWLQAAPARKLAAEANAASMVEQKATAEMNAILGGVRGQQAQDELMAKLRAEGSQWLGTAQPAFRPSRPNEFTIADASDLFGRGAVASRTIVSPGEN